MEDPQVAEPDDPVPLGPDAIEITDEVVPGAVQMAGVGTETDSPAERGAHSSADLGELLEGRAERGAGPRRRLEEDRGTAGYGGNTPGAGRCTDSTHERFGVVLTTNDTTALY